MASPNLQFTHSPHQLRRLKKIQFSVWSPEEIERGSVTRATRLQGNGEQVEDGIFKVNRMVGGTGDYGSLSDKRMGNLNMRDRCMTCNCTYEEGHNMDNCPGHFGHIRLKFRVFHCGYIKQVLKVLKCVCFHCSSLLADDEFKNKHADIFNIKDPVTRNRRLAEEIYKKNLKRKCHQITCGKKQPIIELKPGGRFEYTLEAENENEPLQSHVYLSADIAYEKLRAISDADCKTLGLDPKWARPEWFIVSVLPVPPPHVRPAVEMEGSTGMPL
jgi:DNA-directed RNA polymerase II subunit RPB1